jgi:hypothetical protein
MASCACSIQNAPDGSEMPQPGRLDSHKIQSFTPKNVFWGLYDATFPMQKPSQILGKLTFSGRRFKSPFFLWLIQILKAVAMGVVTVIAVVLAK